VRSLILWKFALLIGSAVVVILTTYKWYMTFRDSASPLATTLCRDGIVFFVCLFCEQNISELGKFAHHDRSNLSHQAIGSYLGWLSFEDL